MVAPGSRPVTNDEETSVIVSKVSKEALAKRNSLSVKFCEIVYVQMIPSRRQLSKEELDDYYLSAIDQQRIRGEAKAYLRLVEEENLNTDDFEEIRGLEKYTRQASALRRQQTRHAIQTVLRQQQLGGPLNEVLVSRVYQNLTSVSAHQAYIQGLKDQVLDRSSPPFQQIMIR